MTVETIKVMNNYCYRSYKDTLSVQVYLADNNIPMSYTDTISLSELDFLLNTVSDYVQEKNKHSLGNQ